MSETAADKQPEKKPNKKPMSREERARLGGLARAKKLSPDRRKEIGIDGSQKRWGSPDENLPRALCAAPVRIGDIEVDAAVLDDAAHTRVLTQGSFLRSIGRSERAASNSYQFDDLPPFLGANNLKPFISAELRSAMSPIAFRTLRGMGGVGGTGRAHGYRATLLVDVCGVYLEARKATNAITGKPVLTKDQLRIADNCETLLRHFAKKAIEKFIDEATGFRDDSSAVEATKALLAMYLRKEFAAYSSQFPEEFYRQIFRLNEWEWRGMRVNRPWMVAQYTRDIVYKRLAPSILKEMERLNPRVNGKRAHRHYDLLTELIGLPALAQHLHAIMGLMRASRNWRQFMDLLDAAFPRCGDTVRMYFPEPDTAAPPPLPPGAEMPTLAT